MGGAREVGGSSCLNKVSEVHGDTKLECVSATKGGQGIS